MCPSFAVNQATNKIYAANNAAGTLTIIDGTTLATTTIPLGVSLATVAVIV